MEQGNLSLPPRAKIVSKEKELLVDAYKRIVELLLKTPDLTSHDKMRLVARDRTLRQIEEVAFDTIPDVGWYLVKNKWCRKIRCFDLTMKWKNDRYLWTIDHTPTELSAKAYVHSETQGKNDMERLLGVLHG